MTALAAQRRIEGNLIDGLLWPFDFPAKTGVTFYNAGLVALEASGGFLTKADGTVATQRIVGIIDLGNNAQLTTTGSDGAFSFKVQAGIWPFKNSSAGDLITQADMFKSVYVADDQTAAKTSNSSARPVLGTAVRLEGGLVWVAVGFPFAPRP